MSKTSFMEGVQLNTVHTGLLCVTEDRLQELVKNEPISNIYFVEHTPFARGKFAAVRKCTHRETGVEYAAKFIRKRRRAMDQRADILHEVAVLAAAARSARIVALHEVYETATEMALVLELAAGGELQRILDVQEGLDELQAARFMKQILEGLHFLHSHNIAHLDLKPQNLLLTGEFPDCDVKLCDFGISRVIQNGVEVREILGTPDYVAPEVLSFEPISLATDIWSVGVLAYVLVSGFSPFGGDTKQETFCNISQCKLDFPDDLFQNVSEHAKDFIRVTLKTDPRKRPSIEESLAHPWLISLELSPKAAVPATEEVTTELETVENGDEPAVENGITNDDLSTAPESSEPQPEMKNSLKNGEFDPLNIIKNFTQNWSDKCSSKALSENGDERDGSEKDDLEEIHLLPKKSKDDFDLHTYSSNNLANQFFNKPSALPNSPISSSASDSEDDKDSPVNKRPKNCPAGRRSSFPVASCLSCAQCGSQCCQHSPCSPDVHLQHHSSIANSPVEITIDRGIIC